MKKIWKFFGAGVEKFEGNLSKLWKKLEDYLRIYRKHEKHL